MKLALLAIVASCCPSAISNVIWERTFDSPDFATGEVFGFAKDPATGSLFVRGVDARQYVVWKFNRWGSLYYRTIIDPGVLLVGKHNDFFTISQEGISRYDSTTGQRVWRQTDTMGTEAYVDESGDIYNWNNVSWSRKLSYLDGRKQWQVQCGLIPVDGPFLIASTSTGPKLLSRSTGAFSPLPLPVPVTDHITGVKVANGRALLRARDNRLFGFRGANSTVLNLGFMDPKYDAISSSSNGGVLFSGHVGTRYMDSNFQMGWTSPQRFDYTEGDTAFRIASYVDSYSLLTGSALRGFFTNLDYIGGLTRHAEDLWIGGSTTNRAAIEFISEQTSTRTGGWISGSKGYRMDQPIAGMVGPSGDLLMLSYSEASLELSRIDAQAGVRRWAIDVDIAAGPGFNLSLSADKRVLGLTTGNDTQKSYEFDVTTAKLMRAYTGWGLINGGFAYRQKGSTTSKFDLATGRELWRVPRTGPISVDPDGSVYIGSTKNAGSNGQLRWTCPITLSSPTVRNGIYLVARAEDKLACVRPDTGAVIWSTADYASYFKVERPECRMSGPDLFVRNGNTRGWKRFDILSGQQVAQRNDGFWAPDGAFWSYRIDKQKLYRYESFDDLVGAPIVDIAMTPKRYILDPTGTGFMLGVEIAPRGDWDVDVIRWQN